MVRLVVDPNVLVSAVISAHGAPAEIVDGWRVGTIELIVSEHLLAELEGVLSRPRFRRWISHEELVALVAQIRGRGMLHADLSGPPVVTSDPKDDYLIALARSANATALVSGSDSV